MTGNIMCQIEGDDLVIIDTAKVRLAECKTDDDCGRVYHQVRERFKTFSLGQQRRDIALRNDELSKADQSVHGRL
ncbi:hypothetical protein P3W85_33815 [Cupriavidus basilensis]|uniref:Uncharacterized protein n=1 Tax=Cupriavidus basilensis TaxID=68895 RepID=A0ABT6AZ36_9BURK|nr:hypothetical protein [Cupriavidus basilensis]MDF3837875.1 hypothetical protein [Cupriavidus basilensis]